MSKISVIIPTYNRADFITETINSVLNQNYQNFEILIIDDGSTDNTKEIVSNIKDKRIKYFYQSNTGVPAIGRNVGLREATGDFIAFLDSDDVWFPNKLSEQLAIFKKNTKLLAVSSNAEYLPHQKIKKKVFIKLFSYRYTLKDLLKSNRVINSSLIMKREVIDYVGFLDENYDLRFVEDYDYWLRIVEFRDKSIYVMKKPLIYYRIHNSNNFTIGEVEFNKLKIIFQKYENKYSVFVKKVSAHRKYYDKVVDIREEYRKGILNKIDLFKNSEINFLYKLDIILKTFILRLIRKLNCSF